MEAAFVLVVLVLGGLVLLPIIALVSSSKLSARVRQAEEDARVARRELDELRRRLGAATKRTEAVDHRLSAWVAFFQQEPRAAPVVSAAPVGAPAPPPSAEVGTPGDAASVAEGVAGPPAASEAKPTATVDPGPEVSPARVAASEARAGSAPLAPAASSSSHDGPGSSLAASVPFDWERLVGVRLFAWLGGGALFLAAALFLHYSIQQDLIAPPVRVAAGLAVGAVALLGGDRVRQRARYAGDALSGAGVAILYAALFAARVLYRLIPLGAAFTGMALVTVTAGLFAVRRNAFFVALLGLLGGMATPFLLSSGADRPVALFAYVALLSCGTVAVARQRGWLSLAMLGLLGAMLVFIAWATRFLVAGRAPYALGAVALVAAPFAFVRIAKPEGELAAARTPAQRLLSGIAALLPLATGVALAGLPTLDVDPTVLALYVLVLSAGAFIADRRGAQAHLPAVAATLASLALYCRVRPDLFPAHEALTLGSFSLVPLAYFAAALALRRGESASAARHAAMIALLGTLPVVIEITTYETAEPIRLALAYAWLGAGGLVAFGVVYAESWYFAAAELVALVALAALVRPEASRLAEFVPPLAASAVFFWALPLTHARCRTGRAAWWASAAALPLHLLLLYAIAQSAWGRSPLGAVSILCAVLTAVSVRGLASRTSDPELRLELYALFGGVTLAFVTASVPLLLENEWLTISWAAEVAALAWLRRRVPHGGLLLVAALLAAGVSVRLLGNEALWTYHARSATPILNYYLYTFGVPALAFLAAQRLLTADDLAQRFRLPAALGFAGAVLLFVLMNVEVADYYSNEVSMAFRVSTGGLAEDMTYSLAWGAFAIALLLVGMATKRRATRVGALTVLVLTIGKVSLHDLWALGALYRVGSIVGLAIALLGVSFLTQRFILPKEQP